MEKPIKDIDETEISCGDAQERARKAVSKWPKWKRDLAGLGYIPGASPRFVRIECGRWNSARDVYLIIDKIFSLGGRDTHNNADCIKVNGEYFYFDDKASAEKAFNIVKEALLNED